MGQNPAGIAISPDGRTAYVQILSSGSASTVTPIDLATGVPGRPIEPVRGNTVTALALSPDSTAVYATSFLSSDSTVPTDTLGTMTVIRTASGRPGTAVNAGDNPLAIAITPDGATAYVADSASSGPGTVTPIQLATGARGKPIPAGREPVAIALTPGTNPSGTK